MLNSRKRGENEALGIHEAVSQAPVANQLGRLLPLR